jgi:quercetin dioxygenase-like cupin family protein
MSINFIIKMIEIAPSGYTDRHSHPYEHGIYVLEGSGEIVEPGGTRPLSTGHVVFIRPEEEHQVINNSRKILRLLNVEPVKVKIRDS